MQNSESIKHTEKPEVPPGLKLRVCWLKHQQSSGIVSPKMRKVLKHCPPKEKEKPIVYY